MPTPSKSVQFRSIDDTVEAYKERGVPAWSIWNNKQFLTKYEGDDIDVGAGMLQSFMEKLISSPAIYTICVYEDWPDGAKIKDTTPYDGSFNFRLSEWNGGLGNAPVPYQDPNVANRMLSVLTAMDKRMTDIEKKMAEEKEEDDDEDRGIVGAVEKILEHPLIEPLIPALVEKIGAWLGPPAPPTGNGHPNNARREGTGQAQGSNGIRISGIEEVETAYREAIKLVADNSKIASSLITLDEKIGRDLPDLLVKLAQLAINRPAQFKIYKAMFDKMKF